MNALAKLLSAEDILLDVDVFDKADLFAQVAQVFQRRYGIDRELAQNNLMMREALGSTGLGHGVAIPHARIAGLEKAVGVLVRTRLAIPFDAPDDKPVSLLLCLLVPEHANKEHLALLAAAAKLFSERQFREQLNHSVDVATVLQQLAR